MYINIFSLIYLYFFLAVRKKCDIKKNFFLFNENHMPRISQKLREESAKNVDKF